MKKFVSQIIVTALFSLIGVMSPVAAQQVVDSPEVNLQIIRSIFKKPDKDIDLSVVKLTIDRMIDPSIDVDASLKKISNMVSDVKALLPKNASQLQKMEALRDYIYKPGPWNKGQVFQYDLDDPFGKNIRNKLLPTYLETRKGNCVSMPSLFVILGQGIGVDLTLSTAPQHVFVKYRGDDGIFYNFEATSGGGILDVSLRRDFPMTDLAVTNGMYMKVLSKKEAVAVLLGTLMEHYSGRKQFEARIAIADLALQYFPADASALIHKGHSYFGIAKRDFESRYLSPAQMPQEARTLYNEISRKNHHWYAKAEELGWRQPGAESEANYSRSIDKAKSEKKKVEAK
jgi:regulator of sirC expression with transglutaminase-like and TPR domain